MVFRKSRINGLAQEHELSFRTPLFNQSVKNNILRDLEGEILWGLFLSGKPMRFCRKHDTLHDDENTRQYYGVFGDIYQK